MSEHTRPSAETRAEEAREATKDHDPGRPATAEEEVVAEQAAVEKNMPSPDVAAHEQEMNERGAKQKGEGRI